MLSFSAASSAEAQSLSFTPQRIVMEARMGGAALTLSNTGKREESYRIDLFDVVYGEDGVAKHVKTTPTGHPTAKNIVRFSPSQIRLAPGEQQKVRILVKAQEKVPDGEYRVHAVLRQLPNVTGVKLPEPGKNQIAGVVGIEQSVAIPVIIRQGVTSATGSIASLKTALSTQTCS
jgi:fimbrial chaperone protein